VAEAICRRWPAYTHRQVLDEHPALVRMLLDIIAKEREAAQDAGRAKG
jgi:CRP-like cAMP-binding protein